MGTPETKLGLTRGGIPRPEDGCRVLITGGSSGIGLAVGRELARRGSEVVLAARESSRLHAACRDVRACAVSSQQVVEAMALDVRDPKAVAAAPEQVRALLGDVDLLVHSAGTTGPGYAANETDQAFAAMVETNFVGACNLTRAFLPQFLARGRGHISFVSSILGFVPMFGYASYCASKAGLGAHAASLREELRPAGVCVSLLFPAEVDTPMLAAGRPTTPWETAAMVGEVEGMDADRLARRYLAGIFSGRARVYPNLRSQVTWHAWRLMPQMLARYFRLRLWLARRLR